MIQQDDIAIIGMSGRFPGANSIDEYWSNLINGIESISVIENKKSDEISAKGRITEPEYFANDFFSFTPRISKIMDPQFRFLLESVWEALEDAGYNPDCVCENNEDIGVYASSSTLSSYYSKNICPNPDYQDPADEYEIQIHNAKDFLATMIAYKYNFKGPAVNIQTACSSSLVAICTACDDLKLGKCNVAIIAASSITFPLNSGYIYKQGMIFSKDGHCKAFSKDASGVVPGNGGGVVILKRLRDAIKSKDNIYAVIKGYAVNNDGSNKLSFTAPTVDGQVSVLKRAATNANIDPSTISYFETHGTGTLLGDEIEVAALKKFVATSKSLSSYLIGSVKTNIGHLDVAAGLASFIKGVLTAKNKVVPKSLHSEELNPKLGFDENFNVSEETQALKISGHHYRVGVSSFGVGGTNAHVIIERYEEEDTDKLPNNNYDLPHFIPISARNELELNNALDRLTSFIFSNKNISLENIAHTLQKGRKYFNCRACAIANNIDELKSKLYFDSNRDFYIKRISCGPKATVLILNDFFTNGYSITNLHLLKKFDTFNLKYNEISKKVNLAINQNHLKLTDDLSKLLDLFTFQVAYIHLLDQIGIITSKVIGYGYSDITSAYLANIFDIHTVIELFSICQKNVDNHYVVSIQENRRNTEKIISNNLYTPYSIDTQDRQTILVNSNDFPKVKKILEDKNIPFKYTKLEINTSDRGDKDWHDLINDIDFNSDKINSGLISNTLLSKNYWLTRNTIANNFYEAIDSCSNDSVTFIDTCPERITSQLVKQVINHKISDEYDFLVLCGILNNEFNYEIIARLWESGVDIDWEQLNPSLDTTKKVSLPTYPFTKKKFLIDYDSQKNNVSRANEEHHYSTDFLYKKTWVNNPLGSHDNICKFDSIFIIPDEIGIVDELITKIESSYHIPVNVIDNFPSNMIGDELIKKFENLWYALLKNVEKNKKILILYAKPITKLRNYSQATYSNMFFELLSLGLAIQRNNIQSDISLIALSEPLNATNSALKGPLLCMPYEIRNLHTKEIIIDLSNELNTIQNQLYNEIFCTSSDNVIWLCDSQRKIPIYKAMTSTSINTSPIPIRKNGYYLVIGGLGGIGLEIADFLAKEYTANIIILSRRELSVNTKFGAYLSGKHSILTDNEKEVLEKLAVIEQYAQSLTISSGNISSINLENLLQQNFTKINGIIYSSSTMPEGILINKSYDAINSMFEAKTYGSNNVLESFKSHTLDFIVFCSALNTVCGGVGLSEYVSGNAYLNHLAQNSDDYPTPLLSICWDAWQETGMRKDFFQAKKKNFIDKKIISKEVVKIIPYKEWKCIVEQHTIKNTPTIPGSLLLNYLYESIPSNNNYCIEKFSFIELGSVENKNCSLYINKCNESDAYVISLNYDYENIQIAVSYVNKISKYRPLDFSLLNDKFEDSEEVKFEYQFDTELQLGQRWHAIDWVKHIDHSYLCKITLPSKYASDTTNYSLAPSVLDIAFSLHARFLDKQYIPFYIEKMIVFNNLPTEVLSHICITKHSVTNGLCHADIDIYNLSGDILVSISNFILKRFEINHDHSLYGISNKEGIDLFKTIMSSNEKIIYVSKDKEYFNSKMDNEKCITNRKKTSATLSPKHVISDDSNILLKDDVIYKLKEIWQQCLEVETINTKDDFFMIGGDSLYAIQVCYKIKQELGLEISPDILIEQAILSDLADYIYCLVSKEK